MKGYGVSVAFTGFYIAFWHSMYPLLTFINTDFDYKAEGLSLGLLCLIAGLLVLLRFKTSKTTMNVALVCNMLVIGAFAFSPVLWLYLLVMVCQGFLLGQVVMIHNSTSGQRLYIFNMVVFAAFAFTTIVRLVDYSNEKLLFGTVGILILFLIMQLLISLKLPSGIRFSSDIVNDNDLAVAPSFTGVMIWMLLTVTEVSLFVWALLLPDYSQSIFSRLVLPLSVAIILILRYAVDIRTSKWVNQGWLFFMILLLTFSMGYYYTMDTPIMFLLFFPVSLVAGQYLASRLYPIGNEYRYLGFFFILLAIVMVIAGFFVDNHIAYIVSIKMPENLLNLSALQAWIKELTSLVAITLVLTGVLYLRRKPVV